MQKRRGDKNKCPASEGKIGEFGGKNIRDMTDAELERACSCPFFRPSFDDFMARERMKIKASTFTPDLEGISMRRRLLERFRIPWESIDHFRSTNGLSFEGFFNYCKKPGAFFSDSELRSNSEYGLRKEAVKFFLRLDADQDGIIGPSDADACGYVTWDSEGECRRHRQFSQNAPYGNRVNPDLKGLHDQVETKARWLEKFIKEKSRTIKVGDRRIYSYDLQVHYLPVWLCGTRLLHISDIHFKGDKSDSSKIDFISSLPKLLEKPPELVLLTGDYITDKLSDMGAAALASLRNLFPSAFRAFVLGNHDLRDGKHLEIREALIGSGYLDLTNRHAKAGINGFHINVFGMDDYVMGQPKVPKITSEQRLETNILITHNLDAVHGALPGAFDLVLSGHTHAGEKNLILFSGFDYLRFVSKEFLNLNTQKKEWKMLSQRTASYVSPGLGSHAGKRFNTEREGVTLISLWG